MADGAAATGRTHTRSGENARYAIKEHRLCDAAEKVRRNGALGTRDIEGKVTRVGASKPGRRASFNGARGTRGIEGSEPDWQLAARVASTQKDEGAYRVVTSDELTRRARAPALAV